MWSPNTITDESPLSGTQLLPTEVLYYFESPILFVARIGLSDMLCHKFEETDYSDFFILSECSAAKISALKEGNLSLRGALTSDNYWVLETSHSRTIKKVWRVREADLHEQYMPERYTPLSYSQRHVPDTLEQANSFFSVRFSGKGLHRGEVSFRRFHALLDEVYEIANRYLVPTWSTSSKNSSILDFQIAEPRLASVLVAIKEPRILNDAIKRRRLNSIVPQDLLRDMDRQREALMNGMDSVLQEAQSGDLSAAFIGENVTWITALNTISPSVAREVEAVEIASHRDGATRMLLMDNDAGSRIKAAHRDLTTRQVTLSGKIVEINAAAGTFVFLADAVRQTTCVMRSEDLMPAINGGKLRVGAAVRVIGSFERRTRRDKITASNITYTE